jgi:hypothetical protein
VTNDGQTPMTKFTVTDTLPNDLTFIGQNSNGFTFSGPEGKKLYWKNYQGTLQPGQSITITFDARVEAIGRHTNWVCLTHPDFPTWNPNSNSSENCDPADVVVKEELFCKVPYINRTLYTANSNGRATVDITCESSNGKSANIIVNCGNGESSPSRMTNSYSYTCTYNI